MFSVKYFYQCISIETNTPDAIISTKILLLSGGSFFEGLRYHEYRSFSQPFLFLGSFGKHCLSDEINVQFLIRSHLNLRLDM